jgi:hypothetical protein
VVAANHMIMAVMSPWVTMYDRAIDVPWTAAKMAESLGLNSSPKCFTPSLCYWLVSHSLKPALIRFFRTSSGLTYEVSCSALISANLIMSSSLTSGFSVPQFSRQPAFWGQSGGCCGRFDTRFLGFS